MGPQMSDTASPERRTSVLSRRKKLAFMTVTAAGVYLFVELACWLTMYVTFGGWQVVLSDMDRIAGHGPAEAPYQEAPEDVLHPYLGWVRRPLQNPPPSTNELHVTEFGFVDTAPPLHQRGEDKIVIGILGGSVAAGFAENGLEALKAELSKSPQFTHKHLVFVRLAVPGFKQPQQLMIVNYLLTLGGEFDILINLDGFNEITLPAVENVPYHVFTAFPRHWSLRVTETSDTVVLRIIGRITELKARTQAGAQLIAQGPLRYSAAAGLTWQAIHRWQDAELIREFEKLNKAPRKELSFARTGPPESFSNEDQLYSHCAAIWQRSSQLIHHTCAAAGIRYYHFLQPNQYVTGSKPFRPDEAKLAVSNHAGRRHVERGYPFLIRSGRLLTAEGVRVHDLTQLFANDATPAYADNCCHFNKYGIEIIARKVAAAILEDD